MAELSNNPFIDHTSTVASRFPSINAIPSSAPNPSALPYSTGWPQQDPSYQSSSGYVGTSPTGYSQQYYQQPQWPQQQQQQQYQSQLQTPYSQTGFQSPSPYSQQYVGQVNSLVTGYPQQPQLQSQYTGYPIQQAASYGYQQQQQQQQPTSYGYPQQQQQQRQLLAQFDPYANFSQQLSPPQAGATLTPTSSASSSLGIGTGTGAVGSPPPGMQHPRIFIHAHKAELEAWDPPTWRQVQSTFESLKGAWETRKRAAEAQVRALGGTVGAPPGTAANGFFGAASVGAMSAGYGAYGVYQTPQAQEIDRLNALIKEAESNIDIIAAAALQMSEVFGGYRHSGDVASKRRVRESCNAAVTGLPEYPPPML